MGGGGRGDNLMEKREIATDEHKYELVIYKQMEFVIVFCNVQCNMDHLYFCSSMSVDSENVAGFATIFQNKYYILITRVIKNCTHSLIVNSKLWRWSHM